MSERLDDTRARIKKIEQAVGDGTYEPGPWAALLRELEVLPRADRRALAVDVTQASNALHRRAGHPEKGVAAGVALEIGATVAATALLIGGAETGSNALTLGGATLLATVAQPLVKLAIGTLLGVRYAYAFLLVLEPRFKMKYGTYLALPRWARVVYHLGGTIGTPLALAWVATREASPTLTAAICTVLALISGGANVSFFVAAARGARKLGPLRLSTTSGGRAGQELRASA